MSERTGHRHRLPAGAAAPGPAPRTGRARGSAAGLGWAGGGGSHGELAHACPCPPAGVRARGGRWGGAGPARPALSPVLSARNRAAGPPNGHGARRGDPPTPPPTPTPPARAPPPLRPPPPPPIPAVVMRRPATGAAKMASPQPPRRPAQATLRLSSERYLRAQPTLRRCWGASSGSCCASGRTMSWSSPPRTSASRGCRAGSRRS
ncbi:atherin-like [Falco biarmicus]|uniref:atherin-like n=1 Tax=Falco biarmicus TaxID=345155 RepID=UPI0024BC08F3|nr:atherin-like [Falco biarmicus]